MLTTLVYPTGLYPAPIQSPVAPSDGSPEPLWKRVFGGHDTAPLPPVPQRQASGHQPNPNKHAEPYRYVHEDDFSFNDFVEYTPPTLQNPQHRDKGPTHHTSYNEYSPPNSARDKSPAAAKAYGDFSSTNSAREEYLAAAKEQYIAEQRKRYIANARGQPTDNLTPEEAKQRARERYIANAHGKPAPPPVHAAPSYSAQPPPYSAPAPAAPITSPRSTHGHGHAPRSPRVPAEYPVQAAPLAPTRSHTAPAHVAHVVPLTRATTRTAPPPPTPAPPIPVALPKKVDPIMTVTELANCTPKVAKKALKEAKGDVTRASHIVKHANHPKGRGHETGCNICAEKEWKKIEEEERFQAELKRMADLRRMRIATAVPGQEHLAAMGFVPPRKEFLDQAGLGHATGGGGSSAGTPSIHSR